MAKPDVVVPVIPANTVKNGSMVVLVFETGITSKRDPDFNHINIPSGTLEDRYAERFDDIRYYTGDTDN